MEHDSALYSKDDLVVDDILAELRSFDGQRPQREHSKLVKKLLRYSPVESWPKDVQDLTVVTRRMLQAGARRGR